MKLPTLVCAAAISLATGVSGHAQAGDKTFETRIGTTSGGIDPGKNLRAVKGSDGMAMDTRVDLTVNITRGFDLNAYALVPLAGEDLQFFPIEDIHPTRGTTIGGTVELRY